MSIAHHLGFPRIGSNRELKWAVECYWRGELDQKALEAEGQRLRQTNWRKQIDADQDFLSVGDFSWYDHVLDTSALLGVVPKRFADHIQQVDIDTYFRMARGRAPTGSDVRACEMTKWFDTNYHYIVPEFSRDQDFTISSCKLFTEILEAQSLNQKVKPILLGPLSYLWLGKSKETNFNKLSLLNKLIPVYKQILTKLHDLNINWVQIDEPILVLDLPDVWKTAFQAVYDELQIDGLNLLLTTYFGALENNLDWVCHLKTAGLHIDAVRGSDQIAAVQKQWPRDKVLSIGIVNGRNIWRNDLRKSLQILQPLYAQRGERLWVGSSCSLLHSPVDLASEHQLDDEIKSWLAFATQKLSEISLLARGLKQGESAIAKELLASDQIAIARKTSTRIHRSEVKKRCANVTPEMTKRFQPYAVRQKVQRDQLNLPLFPTTTIGSFPQTKEIREIRRDFKAGKLDVEHYREKMFAQIALAIRKQLDLKIDVLVHGEAERNDMVEYFGELLEGFVFTQNGWVQSYGSRCVKPPIIFGDVSRTSPMTVEWSTYAQSLTDKPIKGMLTGPITILCWSFVRDDQSRFETAKQIALALRDEVSDLVKAGIRVIQIDEPAIREGLPLRENAWQNYLQNAVYCFRLASCCVPDEIQIHTHMCYAEFNDIIEEIANLDADVITIETSRSDMELLKAFEAFNYPNDIGPGVYDIHSPRIPSIDEITQLIEKAAQYVPVQQIWVNPDCGLKTRDWNETELALQNMVAAAERLREKFVSPDK